MKDVCSAFIIIIIVMHLDELRGRGWLVAAELKMTYRDLIVHSKWPFGCFSIWGRAKIEMKMG